MKVWWLSDFYILNNLYTATQVIPDVVELHAYCNHLYSW